MPVSRVPVHRRRRPSAEPLLYRPRVPALGRRPAPATADVEVPAGAAGVIYAQGSVIDGFSLFIHDGRLWFAHRALGEESYGETNHALPEGRVTLGLRFERVASRRSATFLIDNSEAGSVAVPFSRNAARSGVDIGRDVFSAVTGRYEAPFGFTGTIHEVELRVTPYKRSGRKPHVLRATVTAGPARSAEGRSFLQAGTGMGMAPDRRDVDEDSRTGDRGDPGRSDQRVWAATRVRLATVASIESWKSVLARPK